MSTEPATTYVVLVRGINVGGARKLPMAELRRLCADAGCSDVTTYVQSGNVALRSPSGAVALEAAIEGRILDAFGYDVAVMARTVDELASVLGSGIYASQPDATKRIVAFLKTVPPRGALRGLDPERFAPEEVTLRGRELFFHLPEGQGRAKLPDAVARAVDPIPFTARNWATVEKLHAMASELADA